MMGRFGNNLFQYCFGRAYAEQGGLELRTDPWDGEKLFDISHPRIKEGFDDARNELNFSIGTPNVELRGYFQMQSSLIYTRTQVRSWLKWRKEVSDEMWFSPSEVVWHLRRGDYFGYGYPVASIGSYQRAAKHFILGPTHIVSEECPSDCKLIPKFATDFWVLSHAKKLLRANSSFSWWAGTLADPSQRIYSPVVEGVPPGEHDVEFVEGNWPRFCNLEFVTDLHLSP